MTSNSQRYRQQQEQQLREEVECLGLEDGCYLVCESNITSPGNEERVIRLKFMTDPYGTRLETVRWEAKKRWLAMPLPVVVGLFFCFCV